MYKFEHTDYFYGLIAIAVFILLVLWYFAYRRNRLKRLGEQKLVNQLIPYSSNRKRIIKIVLYCLAFSSLVLALCNLQTGSKLAEVKREGADLIVCLDVSNSMLAQDLTPNRLKSEEHTSELQ